MFHGLVLGGGVLLGFAAALYCMWSVRADNHDDSSARRRCTHLGRLTIAIAAMLWAIVLIGTYVNYPAYRVTPPEGATDLSAYPRALLRANPDTAWLHGFALEFKEHAGWIAAILMTGVAFIINRYHTALLAKPRLFDMTTAFVLASFGLTAIVGLLGVFVNKVAPII
jgi:hypothetical protein